MHFLSLAADPPSQLVVHPHEDECISFLISGWPTYTDKLFSLSQINFNFCKPPSAFSLASQWNWKDIISALSISNARKAPFIDVLRGCLSYPSYFINELKDKANSLLPSSDILSSSPSGNLLNLPPRQLFTVVLWRSYHCSTSVY